MHIRAHEIAQRVLLALAVCSAVVTPSVVCESLAHAGDDNLVAALKKFDA